MMKKIIAVSLLGIVSTVHAESFEAKDHIMLTDGQKNEMFTSRGLPLPGEPVKVIPAATLGEMGEKSARIIKARKASVANKGYTEEDNFDAARLYADIDRMRADVKANLDNTNPKQTHLRASIDKLQMGYEFNQVPDVFISEIIGFSPWGSYAQGIGWSGGGWNGAAEFFIPKDIPEALCIFNESNLTMTGGTATLFQEVVSKTINDKVSVVDISGNQRTAFSYKIDWWDGHFRHELECIQKTYSKDTIGKVISIAKTLDNSIS